MVISPTDKFKQMKKASNGDYSAGAGAGGNRTDASGNRVYDYTELSNPEAELIEGEKKSKSIIEKESEEEREKKAHSTISPDHDKLREKDAGVVDKTFLKIFDFFDFLFAAMGMGKMPEQSKAPKAPAPKRQEPEIEKAR
jgi:hypothetical protein